MHGIASKTKRAVVNDAKVTWSYLFLPHNPPAHTHTTHTCRIDRVVSKSIGVAANAIRDLIIVGNKQNNAALHVASGASSATMKKKLYFWIFEYMYAKFVLKSHMYLNNEYVHSKKTNPVFK